MTKPEQSLVTWSWDTKYRYKEYRPDGFIASDENTPHDTNMRVSRGVYPDDEDSARAICQEIDDRRFIPAGRILSGAGTGLKVTLFNCFVSSELQDSLDTEPGLPGVGIMDGLKVATITQQMGGGIGIDFSPLRPKGSEVKQRQTAAGGPLDFMDLWDRMGYVIMGFGSRRAAMMATLSDDHPDVLEFITAKHDPDRFRMFNVSVLVSDAFMNAVAEDCDWDLGFNKPAFGGSHDKILTRGGKPWYVYRTIRARDLWDAILRSTYDHAEPGVIFIDRINQTNNLKYCEEIRCTNPCGEQPLPPDANCLLGAIGLHQMVDDPFGDLPELDYDQLNKTVRLAVRFLDRIINLSDYPTEAQRQEGLNKRRIGLGVMGLGTMLQQLKVPYGTQEARSVANRVMYEIARAAYSASIELAIGLGSFPMIDREAHAASPMVKKLQLSDEVREYGIRNGVILTIAPTGTTSIYAGNCSGGVEPSFGWSYTRKVLQPDRSMKEEATEDYGWRQFVEVTGHKEGDPLPDYMVTAHDLSVEDHVLMQAACQEWVDASISKTINCPQDISFEEFRSVYDLAYDKGLKSCTTYRPNPESGRGEVLSINKPAEAKTDTAPAKPVARPDILPGQTYKISSPDHSYYVTINDDENGRPFEVFLMTKAVVYQEWMNALAITLSALMRECVKHDEDIKFIIEDFLQVHSPVTGYWSGGSFVPSIVAGVGRVLAHHTGITVVPSATKVEKVTNTEQAGLTLCPACQQYSAVMAEGCVKCLSCGFSNCG